MKKMNVSNYYYLKEGKQIKESEITSGATKFDNQWITNYNESNELILNDTNKLSIYVPSTIDVDKVNKNFDSLTEKIKNELNTNFQKEVQKVNTEGAWRTEKGELVKENICILTIDTDNQEAINYFISLAQQLKQELTQEAVSVGVNNGLLII